MNLPVSSLQWRHNGRDGVSNHQLHACLLNRLFRRRLKKTFKLRVTGLCEENPPVTGEFPAQMASNAENVSIWCIVFAAVSSIIGLVWGLRLINQMLIYVCWCDGDLGYKIHIVQNIYIYTCIYSYTPH